MHRSVRSLAALAGAAALALSPTSPASAERHEHQDARKDVVTASFPDESADPELVPTPDNAANDVTRLVIGHRVYRLNLRLRLRDVNRDSGIAVYDVRTGTRRYTVLQRLGALRGFPAVDIMRAGGRPVRCGGLENTVDREQDAAVLSIPRRCLGRPAWVQAGAGIVGLTPVSEELPIDDALVDGDFMDLLRLSPRVSRERL